MFPSAGRTQKPEKSAIRETLYIQMEYCPRNTLKTVSALVSLTMFTLLPGDRKTLDGYGGSKMETV